ncbi:TetR/AcrR family transcriptional regulator [Pelagibacterium halotolerans]|uniref:TetR/AcrR family transcriptional regulator n=1 Tax=Pelagibacterium halotolerans TaxID=531813 RepID=UPI00384F9460
MARRSDADREATRARVLDVARTMIAEEGPGAISARTLAKRVGLLPGSLYNLFPSIEDIRLAALGDVLRGLGDALAEVPQGLEPRQRMHAYARKYLEYISANSNAWNALFEYRRNATLPAPEWYQAYIGRLTAMIGQCFADHAPKRSLAAAQRQAHLLWAGIYGLTALAAEGRLDGIMQGSFDELVSDLVETHLVAFQA